MASLFHYKLFVTEYKNCTHYLFPRRSIQLSLSIANKKIKKWKRVSSTFSPKSLYGRKIIGTMSMMTEKKRSSHRPIVSEYDLVADFLHNMLITDSCRQLKPMRFLQDSQ
jgi:hypothetical protein